MHWIGKGFPARTVLRICGVPRSTYYYRLQHLEPQKPAGKGRPIPGYSFDQNGNRVPDSRIKSCIRKLLNGPDAAFGYRKLTVLIRRKYKLVINKKKVYRLCKEMKLLAPQREIKNRPPKKLANNRVVTGPNQLWQLDVKYGYVAGQRRHFYLASIIDVFDRAIVAYHRGKACDAEDITRTVQKGLLKRKVYEQENQLIIRTDNGPQFISNKFYEFSKQSGFEHERIPNKTPNKNAYIESFHSILERECYQRNCFETYEEAFSEVDAFVRYYNTQRIHGSLNDRSPKEYLQMVKQGAIIPEKIAL